MISTKTTRKNRAHGNGNNADQIKRQIDFYSEEIVKLQKENIDIDIDNQKLAQKYSKLAELNQNLGDDLANFDQDIEIIEHKLTEKTLKFQKLSDESNALHKDLEKYRLKLMENPDFADSALRLKRIEEKKKALIKHFQKLSGERVDIDSYDVLKSRAELITRIRSIDEHNQELISQIALLKSILSDSHTVLEKRDMLNNALKQKENDRKTIQSKIQELQMKNKMQEEELMMRRNKRNEEKDDEEKSEFADDEDAEYSTIFSSSKHSILCNSNKSKNGNSNILSDNKSTKDDKNSVKDNKSTIDNKKSSDKSINDRKLDDRKLDNNRNDGNDQHFNSNSNNGKTTLKLIRPFHNEKNKTDAIFVKSSRSENKDKLKMSLPKLSNMKSDDNHKSEIIRSPFNKPLSNSLSDNNGNDQQQQHSQEGKISLNRTEKQQNSDFDESSTSSIFSFEQQKTKNQNKLIDPTPKKNKHQHHNHQSKNKNSTTPSNPGKIEMNLSSNANTLINILNKPEPGSITTPINDKSANGNNNNSVGESPISALAKSRKFPVIYTTPLSKEERSGESNIRELSARNHNEIIFDDYVDKVNVDVQISDGNIDDRSPEEIEMDKLEQQNNQLLRELKQQIKERKEEKKRIEQELSRTQMKLGFSDKYSFSLYSDPLAHITQSIWLRSVHNQTDITGETIDFHLKILSDQEKDRQTSETTQQEIKEVKEKIKEMNAKIEIAKLEGTRRDGAIQKVQKELHEVQARIEGDQITQDLETRMKMEIISDIKRLKNEIRTKQALLQSTAEENSKANEHLDELIHKKNELEHDIEELAFKEKPQIEELSEKVVNFQQRVDDSRNKLMKAHEELAVKRAALESLRTSDEYMTYKRLFLRKKTIERRIMKWKILLKDSSETLQSLEQFSSDNIDKRKNLRDLVEKYEALKFDKDEELHDTEQYSALLEALLKEQKNNWS